MAAPTHRIGMHKMSRGIIITAIIAVNNPSNIKILPAVVYSSVFFRNPNGFLPSFTNRSNWLKVKV